MFIVLFIVLFFNNKSLRWMALCRSHFQCGKCEGRRSQSSEARTPSLALPPRWARKKFCVVVCTALLTFVCMLRYWMRNVVPRGLQWNCNEVLDVRCTSAEFCSPCGVQQGAAAYAAYAARSPQFILCNNIYPIEIYKVPFDTFRLSVELPIQKHTDTS